MRRDRVRGRRARVTRTQPGRPGTNLELLEDRRLLAIFVVNTTADSGTGSLRQAIIDANAASGADLIQFNLGGNLIIPVDSQLPAITDAVTIDGTSQPGYDGTPQVRVSGVNTTNATGLRLNGNGITVKGLVINRFQTGIAISGNNNAVQNSYIGPNRSGTGGAGNTGDGIVISGSGNLIGGDQAGQGNVISGNTGNGILINGSGASNNVIAGNVIGLGIDGVSTFANTARGVIVNGSPGTTLGGTTPAARNIIAGNDGPGVIIQGSTAGRTAVIGNYIGTDVSGTLARPNFAQGLVVNGAPGVSIGGTLAGAGNVISGNSGDGILIQGATAQNTVVEQNFIGTQADGATALANTGSGIKINGAVGSIIGGDTAAEGNVIAFNGTNLLPAPGIHVFTGVSNRILSNSIFSNTGLGIDLGNLGVTPNQVSSPSPTLPNQGQNFPVLTKVETAGSFTNVVGTLNSIPDGTFLIQFFSDPGDPSGYGEGKTFLGSLTVTANSNGLATIDGRLGVGVPVGSLVTATATDITKAVSTNFCTSEFAQTIAVGQANSVDLQVTSTLKTSPVLINANATIEVTVSNAGPDAATDVVLQNVISSNAEFISADAGTYDNATRTLTVNIASLPAGSSQVITIVVKPNTTQSLNNTATVSSPEIDADTSNNRSTLQATVNPAVDLQVTVTAAPEPVAVGDTITYLVSIQNLGPSPSTGVTATVLLPDTLGAIVVDTQGAFTLIGNLLTVPIGQLAVNGVATITVKGSPGTVGSVVATASATSTEADVDATNNSTTITSNVVNAADLTLAVTATPDPVLAGAALTYDVSVTNNGPSDATGATLSYTVPANATLISATSDDGKVAVNGNQVTITFNTFSNGGIVAAKILVSPSASGTLVSNFQLTNPSEVDLKPEDNTVQSSVLVSPADLGVTVTGPIASVFSGAAADFTIVVSNNGPSTANNVVVTSLLPAGLTFNGATITNGGSFQVNGRTFTANLASLPGGGFLTIVITATPDAAGTVAFSATASADEFDPVQDNDSATVEVLVDPVDLAASIQSGGSQVVVGSNLVYTFTVTNNGPADATGVVLTSPILSNGALVGFTTSTGSASVSSGKIVFNVGGLASGNSATITITFRADAAGTYAPTATVTSTQSDTDDTNNTVVGSLPVVNLPGTFVVASTTASVKEDAGSVTITVRRVLGNLGTTTIHYATSNGTALAGTNYTAVSGTLTFLAGESVKTIVIPIRRDGQITDNLNFTLNLSSPTGGALLGNPSSTTVTVVNVDRDLVAPKVSGVQAITANGKITGFLITFNEAMTAATAGDLRNYAVAISGKDLAKPTGDTALTLSGATYIAAQNAVRIDLARPQALNRFYKISVNGSNALAPTDRYGNRLDGDANGTAGGNYLAFNGLGSNLRYIDSNGDAVTIKMTGGGTMSLTRGANGEGVLLNLLNINPRRSKIGGTVKRLRGRGDGRTLINTITGFGKFGDVFSVLTTPPFFTKTQATSSSASAIVPVVGTKAVPQGPKKK